MIAGVNKAGTTSLFVSLSEHPQVAPSAVKETRYFLPARYGKTVPPVEVYDSYFDRHPETRVRLEATPSYFYGGEPLARAIDETLPVAGSSSSCGSRSRARSRSSSTRRPGCGSRPTCSIEDYLAHADTLTDTDFLDPANERYFAVGGSRYADFLPGWLEVFGPDRLLVIDFDDLTRTRPGCCATTATWIGLDPTLLPSGRARRRRTGRWRSRAGGCNASRSTVNDRFERILRRYPRLKRRMRGVYFKLNGQAAGQPHRRRRARRAGRALPRAEPGPRGSARGRPASRCRPGRRRGRAHRRHPLTPDEPDDPDVDRGADDADRRRAKRS